MKPAMLIAPPRLGSKTTSSLGGKRVDDVTHPDCRSHRGQAASSANPADDMGSCDQTQPEEILLSR